MSNTRPSLCCRQTIVRVFVGEKVSEYHDLAEANDENDGRLEQRPPHDSTVQLFCSSTPSALLEPVVRLVIQNSVERFVNVD